MKQMYQWNELWNRCCDEMRCNDLEVVARSEMNRMLLRSEMNGMMVEIRDEQNTEEIRNKMKIGG